MTLCKKLVTKKDETAGKEALRYLQSSEAALPDHFALESLRCIIDCDYSTLPDVQDDVTAALVRRSPAVRKYIAGKLQGSITAFFDNIYERGDGSVVSLDTVVLDSSSWDSEETRLQTEKDLFLLLLAKLMESGHDNDARSLKGITRLLAVDAHRLQDLFDDENFDAILSELDFRLPNNIRSQATLATVKYLEVAQEAGHKLFSEFVTSRVKRQRNEDFIVAFSAAASVFPVVPAVTAALFLTEGFLQSLMPLLDRKKKSSDVDEALLGLLNAACMDRACREAIAKYCSEWLSHLLSDGSDHKPAMAAVVLTKLRAGQDSPPEKDKAKVVNAKNGIEELASIFKNMMVEKKASNFQDPIEGLAYASVNPNVKEQLAKDGSFLKSLLEALLHNLGEPSIIFGGLTIIQNLTVYPPNMTEEQKKLSQLKAYADTTRLPTIDPFDQDTHVSDRCKAVVDAGFLHLLIESNKSDARWTSIRTSTNKIILSLSKNRALRGKIAQQGAVKLLLSSRLGNTEDEAAINRDAAHALARILISADPSLIFPSTGYPQITSAVRPLVTLLGPSAAESASDQGRDLLPTFEGLLALTNLASSPDPRASEAIIRQAWNTVEDMLLSKHVYLQRASCELICNLTSTESGVAMFADGSRRAAQRLHLLLALADVEDPATRRAAGGGLAMLTDYDAAIKAILDIARTPDILLALCQDEDAQLVHRGVVCIRNLTTASGDLGTRACDAFKKKRGVEILKGCLRGSNDPSILEAGVEALKPLIA